MGIVTIDKLAPGMTLAADVKDRGGRVILSAGNELTEKHLKILRMWGITQADVKGGEAADHVESEAPQVDPEILREAGLRVQHLFLHAGNDTPVIQELRRLSIARLIRLTEEGSHGR